MDHRGPAEGQAGHRSRLERAAQISREYLGSAEAVASVAADPYWPKWNSPWWHALALREAGFEVPGRAVCMLLDACQRHYLPFFPRSAAELPVGKTLRHHAMCFCALGCVMALGEGLGRVEWADEFFAANQAPDGGWNCDEGSRAGSVVSTVPVLEYLLGKAQLSRGERESVDRGMGFLFERRLVRSRRTLALLDPRWMRPTLPRFYRYDLLRGLRLVVQWTQRTGQRPPAVVSAEALAFRLPRSEPELDSTASHREHGSVATFALLDVLQEPQIGHALLSEEWGRVQHGLAAAAG